MNKFAVILILAASTFLSACAYYSKHMSPSTKFIKVSPATTTVVFIRQTSLTGSSTQATVYDETEYLGALTTGTKLSYETTPGPHRFMVLGQTADFIQANLEAGKIYYVTVESRIEQGKYWFSFSPQNWKESKTLIQQWMSSTQLLAANKKGMLWATKHRHSILNKHDHYLKRWMNKSKDNQQILHAHYGQ